MMVSNMKKTCSASLRRAGKGAIVGGLSLALVAQSAFIARPANAAVCSAPAVEGMLVGELTILGAIQGTLVAMAAQMGIQMQDIASSMRASAKMLSAGQFAQTQIIAAGNQGVADATSLATKTAVEAKILADGIPPPTTKHACAQGRLHQSRITAGAFAENMRDWQTRSTLLATRPLGNASMFIRRSEEARCGGVGVTDPNQKVPTGNKIDGYPTECQGRDEGQFPTADGDMNIGVLLAGGGKFMMPVMKDGTYEGKTYTYPDIQGAVNTEFRYQQEKWLLADQFCKNAIGPYPAMPYKGQQDTQRGKVAVAKYATCMPDLSAKVSACHEYFAMRTRPNPKDPKTVAAFNDSAKACIAAKKQGITLPPDFNNCEYGLSKVELRLLDVMRCASNEHANAQANSGSNQAKIIQNSEMCGLAISDIQSLEAQEYQNLMVALNGMKSARECFADHQKEMLITAEAETGRRTVRAEKTETIRDKDLLQPIFAPFADFGKDENPAMRSLPRAIAQ